MEQVQSRNQTKRFSLNMNKALTSTTGGESTYNVLPRNPTGIRENKWSRLLLSHSEGISKKKKNNKKKQFTFLKLW